MKSKLVKFFTCRGVYRERAESLAEQLAVEFDIRPRSLGQRIAAETQQDERRRLEDPTYPRPGRFSRWRQHGRRSGLRRPRQG